MICLPIWLPMALGRALRHGAEDLLGFRLRLRGAAFLFSLRNICSRLRPGLSFQLLVRRLAVHGLFVMAEEDRALHDRGALVL